MVLVLLLFALGFNELPFKIRSNAKMKTVKESYQRGVDRRIAENREVLRVCIFIKGEPNTGKTYTSLAALAGKRIYKIDGGGSGKFDNLRPDREAIVISDEVCPNLLNMADNYICKAYRRQNNNPAWAGNYFVVTSNLSFDDWVVQSETKNFMSEMDREGQEYIKKYMLDKAESHRERVGFGLDNIEDNLDTGLDGPSDY